MSLAACKRVHSRTEIKLKDGCTLHISQNLLNKITMAHHFVSSNTEWSGVLIYSTKSGSVNDPSTWVIEAEDMALMDIGNAAYTEYEFDPSDDYSYELYTEALLAGKKLGHIHTHHNMGCFFSGTDTSELHDNAPNHNYYLSLIVNYKDHTNWVAEVAICADITTSGTIKRSTNYLNKDGFEDRGEVEEELNQTQPVLYRIPCKIEVPEEESSTYGRVKALAKAKAKTVFPRATSTSSAGWKWWEKDPAPGSEEAKAQNAKVKNSGIQSRLEFNNKKKEEEEGKEEKEEIIVNQDLRPDNCYTPAKVKPFLLSLLVGEMKNTTTLEKVLLGLSNLTEQEVGVFVETIEADFENKAQEYFELDDLYAMDTHCITLAIQDILTPYTKSDFVDELTLALDTSFVLDHDLVDEREEFRLTGLLLIETA